MTPIKHNPRLAALREMLTESESTGLWVTKPVNVRWICGFTGSNGQLLITQTRSILFTDGRYQDQAKAEFSEAGLESQVEISIQLVKPEQGLAELEAKDWSLGRIGIESDHLTVARRELIAKALPATELVNQPGLIDELRQIKDPAERERLELAAAIADSAILVQQEQLVAGVSEQAFAAELDHRMRLLGAEGVSFETIVASGPNSALPHHQPSGRKFEDGDLVVIDFGAKVDGYGSDMTRTFVVGGEPSDKQVDLYDAVMTAQAAGVARVAAGVPLKEVDSACRSVLEDRGYGEAFTHGTGHSLGLEIHEQPMLSSRSVGILRAGLIVTVEPGAYLPGFGGVRIEDSVVVTATGCETITHAPKGLIP